MLLPHIAGLAQILTEDVWMSLATHNREKPRSFSSEIPCAFWTYHKIPDDVKKKGECRQSYLISFESFRVLYWSHSCKRDLPDTDFPHLYFFNEYLIWAIWGSYCFIRNKEKKYDMLIWILDATGKISLIGLFCLCFLGLNLPKRFCEKA